MTDREVLRRALEALKEGRAGALATVVSVEGSAYQREGAKLFIGEGGEVCGLISGGCLESEVAMVAAQAAEDGRTRVLRYDTGDESIFGYGMGCPGIVDVLLEPLPKGEAAGAYIRWLEAVVHGDGAVRAVITGPARDGELHHVMIDQFGERSGSLDDPSLDDMVAARGTELHGGGEASRSEPIGSPAVEVYFDVTPSQPRLVVFGAGDDAQPLAKMAQTIGMRVEMVDPRPAMATAERFPGAKLSLLQPAQYSGVPVGAESYVVVMGHQMERDEAALAHALGSPAPYVGLLSSRGRRERMLLGLQNRGALPDGARSRLFAPIGLDIGAKSPEEIALAILAEIVAQRHGRGGSSLSAH